MEPAAAILLAAGESRRMGSLKALLPWHGSTLLAHQIASLRQAGVDPVVVVLGHEAGRLKPEVEGKGGPMQMDDWFVDRAASIVERSERSVTV